MSSSIRDPAERAVAVIGVGAVLPDAPDAKTFWRNVIEGRSSITEVTPDRWSIADYWDPDPKAPGKTYSKIGGWVRGISFEPTKLKIPPRVAAAMDEGQKWVLLCAGEALRDVGHTERPLASDSTAVILANAMGGERHYETVLRLSYPEYASSPTSSQDGWPRSTTCVDPTSPPTRLVRRRLQPCKPRSTAWWTTTSTWP
jgi:acyl transferase domain-containing protein